MARHRRTGRPCKFESLEQRNLLAGDVTASIVHGDLVIKGDDLANGITITAGATTGTVTIAGVSAGGSATSVNGSSNGTVTLSGFTDDLKISMKGGDDTVSITDLNVPGKLKLKGGDGADKFTLTGVTVGGKLKVNLGDGSDDLAITDTDVTGKARIKGKNGDDDVTIDSSTFSKLRTSLGHGTDTLDISGSTTSGKARFNGGPGTDTFTNGTGNTLASFSQKNFENGASDTTTPASETAPSLSISGAASVNEGALYTLNLSSSGSSSISKWTITWGDSSAPQVVTGNPSSVTHIFADGGATRTISATATDASGTSNANNTVSVTVNNVAPTPSISGPASINEGALYVLNLASSDPGTDTISQWVIDWGDGSAAQTVTGSPNSASHTFTDGPATRTISAKATDEDGTFNAANTVTVAVNNVAPAVSISGSPNVNEGSLYTLSLSSTDPGTDTISQWVINWGDGSAAQTVPGNPSSVTHTFADGTATRTISATATDEDGTTSTSNTISVTVNNVAPLLSIGGATSVSEGSLYTLNLTSSDPGADTITQWTINWGDNTPSQVVSGNPSSVTHTFADGTGLRTIIATATDEDSTFAVTNSFAVIVDNVSPTLTLSGAASVNEGALYTLNLQSSDPGDDTIVNWTINWGDGSPLETVVGNPTSVTRTFADGPATRTISATATDEDGTFNAGNTVVVSVVNVAPALAISGAASIDEGALYTLNLTSSDPGADTVSHWTISWGDGSADETVVGNPTTASHYFSDGPANVTISATATDEDGTFAAGNTVSVAIQNVAPTISLTGPTSVDEGSANFWTIGPTSDPGADQVTEFTVHWGDGATQTFSAGQVSAYNHIYDQGPNNYTITIDLVDEDGTYLAVASLDVTVNDVAPIVNLSYIAPYIYENNSVTLTGSYVDPDVLDAQTVTINWGDPNNSAVSTFALPAQLVLSVGDTFTSSTDGAVLTVTGIEFGPVNFSVQHFYADDGIAPGDGVASNTSFISVSVLDDDGLTGFGNTNLDVYDVAATLDAEPFDNVLEQGYLTFKGTYTDPGLLDAQTLSINWNDPNNAASSLFQLPAVQDNSGAATLTVGQTINSSTDSAVLTITSVDNVMGQVKFTVQHQYVDDGYQNDGFGTSFPLVYATITGDDSASQGIFRYATVSDVAPTVSVDPIGDISEGGTVTLTGSYTDPGILDSQTIAINWGDPNSSNNLYFNIPAIQDISGDPTLHVGDTFLPNFGSNALTITSINASTGEVHFSVQHQYVDDGQVYGNGINNDAATISVSVTDDDGQAGGYTTSITVYNVAPTVSLDPVVSVTESFVNPVVVTGSFTDVGLYDGHIITVDWGDPNAVGPSTFYLSPVMSDYGGALSIGTLGISSEGAALAITSIDSSTGTVGFSITRPFADDGVAPGNGTTSDVSTIDVTVSDDDGDSAKSRRFVTVNNSSPTVDLNPVAGATEGGLVEISGSFTDAGVLDYHTLKINWGDPNNTNDATFSLPPAQSAGYFTYYSSTTDNTTLVTTFVDYVTGKIYFSASHRYADDGVAPGNGTVSDISAISVTVTDDDGQSGSNSRFVTISNFDPLLFVDPVTDILVNNTATLTGAYADEGRLDPQTLSIQWADLTTGSTFSIPALQDANGNLQIAVGNTFSSTSDSAVLTITGVDSSNGSVQFSVHHQYVSTGVFGITLSMLDDDGGKANVSANIAVLPNNVIA